MRILVINDTQEILELFHEILSDEGHEVILHSFTIHDMDEVDEIKPDMIILDHIFGEEKLGWQMLQKLKMRRSTASIPVVVCTSAMKEAKEMEGFLKSKNVGLVMKPFEIDELLNAIEIAQDTDAASSAYSGAAEGDEVGTPNTVAE